jgi:hypothetical protein
MSVAIIGHTWRKSRAIAKLKPEWKLLSRREEKLKRAVASGKICPVHAKRLQGQYPALKLRKCDPLKPLRDICQVFKAYEG